MTSVLDRPAPPPDLTLRYGPLPEHVADPAALPPPPVPVTLLHGTADEQVPAGMSRAFPAGTLVEIPGPAIST